MAMSPVMMNWSSGAGGSLSRSLKFLARLETALLLLSEGTSDWKTVPAVLELVVSALVFLFVVVVSAFQEFRMDQIWSSRSSRCRWLEASDVLCFRCRREEDDVDDDDDSKLACLDGANAEVNGIGAIKEAIAIAMAIPGSSNGADADEDPRNFMILAFVSDCVCGILFLSLSCTVPFQGRWINFD